MIPNPGKSASSSNITSSSNNQISSPHNERVPMPKCACRENAVLQTSWSFNNPSRRYFSCKSKKCNWWVWYDRELTAWERCSFNHLRKKMEALQEELSLIRSSNKEKSITDDLKELKEQQRTREHPKVAVDESINAQRIEMEKYKRKSCYAKSIPWILFFIVCVQFIIIYSWKDLC